MPNVSSLGGDETRVLNGYMNKVLGFIKRWMLPIAMLLGISLYFAFHSIPFLKPAEDGFNHLAASLQPIFVSIMLFLQFVAVSPSQLRVHKCFYYLLVIQATLFIALSLVASRLTDGGSLKVIVECAMLCFICPTAAAAGVITRKIGGSLSEIMAYTILINAVAAILIPLMFPMVHPSSEFSFLRMFLKIAAKVFSILLLPCAAAWLIRWCLPKVHAWLFDRVGWAFYLWAISLTLALAIATKSLVLSGLPLWVVGAIGAVTLVCCLLQFWTGRRVGRHSGAVDSITAGQALGQKNTGFIIWLGYSFLTPVTSIAGGFYSIWHNIVNSYELYRKEKSSPSR